MTAGKDLDPFRALRDALDGTPVIAYLARTIADGSPHVDQLIDEMVEDSLTYLADGIEKGLIKPTENLRETAAPHMPVATGRARAAQARQTAAGDRPDRERPHSLIKWMRINPRSSPRGSSTRTSTRRGGTPCRPPNAGRRRAAASGTRTRTGKRHDRCHRHLRARQDLRGDAGPRRARPHRARRRGPRLPRARTAPGSPPPSGSCWASCGRIPARSPCSAVIRGPTRWRCTRAWRTCRATSSCGPTSPEARPSTCSAGCAAGLNRRRRDELIERFDLDPSKKGRTYSKGNRQKVAIVAALAVRRRAAAAGRADSRPRPVDGGRVPGRDRARPRRPAVPSCCPATSSPRWRSSPTGSASSGRAGSCSPARWPRCGTSPGRPSRPTPPPR